MSKSRAIPLFAALGLLLAACAPAPSAEDLQQTIQVAIALTALANTAAPPAADTAAPVPATEEPTVAPADTATPEPTLAPPTETPSLPSVVFLAEGTFSEADKDILRTRVVEPFALYYAGLPGHPALLSITIDHSASLADYPYQADAVFEGGAYEGWLIHATGGLVDWWLPDCMGPCGFSDPFRTAYPDLVATAEP